MVKFVQKSEIVDFKGVKYIEIKINIDDKNNINDRDKN